MAFRTRAAMRATRFLWGGVGVLFAIALGVISGGCQSTPPPSDWVLGRGHTVTNFFREQAQLPVTLRRLAVLPLTGNRANFELEAGRETLEPVLHAELSRSGLFEVLPVSREKLRQWTGRTSWRADERLHPELFEVLKAQVGADAILFSELSEYRPYAPVSLGWKLRLVEVERHLTWWSVDEVFDGSMADVANGARRFQQGKAAGPGPLADSRVILSSPRLFAQYSLTEILATLPRR